MEKKFFDFHSQKVRNVLGIGVVALALASLSACSDDAPDNNGGNDKPIADETTTEQVNIVVKSDPSLASTFRKPAPMSLAEVTIPSVPTADELAAMNVVESGTNLYGLSSYNDSPKFVVNTGATQISSEVYLQNESTNWQQQKLEISPIYYINGEVEVSGIGGPDMPMEIHVLPGATFKCDNRIGTQTSVYLYDGGQILRAGKDGEIHLSGTLITEGNINVPTADIVVGGDLYALAKIHGKNVTLNGGNIYAGCAVTAENTVYFTGNSKMSTGYVSAPRIELASQNGLEIEIRDGGYLHATKELYLEDVPVTKIYAEKGGAALVEAPTLLVNQLELDKTFFDVEVKYTTHEGDVHGELVFNETCNTKENLTYTLVDGDDCAPIKVVDPNETEEPDPTPELEDVGTITGPEHDHPISATSIFVNNGTDAYISWHTQGDKFHGCIEHATVENNVVTLKSYLETSASNEKYGTIDFNHVIFDNGTLFVAGDHPEKGGILGWIKCDGGTFPTNNAATLNMRPLYEYRYETTNNAGEEVKVYSNGGSGNCIIRNGKYYQTASVAGFETFNVSSFDAFNEDGTRAKIKPVANLDSWKFNSAASKPAQPWKRDGKNTGKHIATDGENVVMLTLIDRDNTTNKATASIRVYSADDVKYENLLASYVINNAVLTPVNGKNVIAIEGNDIWVCLGKGGVKHLTMSGTSISETASFRLADYSKEELKAGKWNLTVKEAAAAAANGLAVDSKYVYVAHGGAGLIVLNKGDMSVVTKTKNYKGSANYVALANEHIYVAHGEAKVRVFKLNEK